MAIRILVTYNGETGYLHSETDLNLRTLYGVTFDEQRTANYPTRRRAERMAEKIAHRFERVEIEEDESSQLLDSIDQLD